jgi:N-acetylglucosamine-6-phosphate deacetylase
MRAFRAALLPAIALLPATPAHGQQAPVNGMRPSDPSRFALVGAKVMVAPGETLETGTIIVRDGVIEAIGADATVPAGYRVYDVKGKTVLPAFIEAALPIDSTTASAAASASPGAHWNAFVVPEVSAQALAITDANLDALRTQGFAVARVLPATGIFRGSSETRLLVKNTERPLGRDLGGARVQTMGTRSVDWSQFFQNPAPGVAPGVAPQPRGERSMAYPSSLMGSIALMRQTLMDAKWRDASRRAAELGSPIPTDDMNALDALLPLVAGTDGLLLDAADELDAARLLRLASEQLPSARVEVLGGGNEFRNEAELRALVAERKAALILPVEFPQAPDLVSPTASESISLRDLMTWRYAPTNPKRFVATGTDVALTTHRLADKAAFRKRLADAVAHGLTKDEALAALTTVPARILGIDARVGTLAAGKLANIVVAAGDPFASDTKFEGMFIAGTPVVAMPEAPVLASGSFDVTAQGATPKPLAKDLRIAIDAKDGSIKASWAGEAVKNEGEAAKADAEAAKNEGEAAKNEGEAVKNEGEAAKADAEAAKADARATASARRTSVAEGRFSGMIDGTPFGCEGDLRIAIAGVGDAAQLIAESADGTRFHFTLRRVAAEDGKVENAGKPANADPAKPQGDAGEKDGEKGGENKEGANKEEATKDEAKKNEPAADAAKAGSGRKRAADEDDKSKLWKDALPFPLGEYGLTARPLGGTVLFRNATIWTQGPAGTLGKGDILVRDGKIAAVGAGIDAPEGSAVLDLSGMHVTPGLIDCHSHTGISGGVNEGTQSNTAEVWIGDVIDPTDIEWYRQLAGGLTAVNQLHGSANPIGGRNSVVKIRWGETAEGFRFAEAPSGIKFALGENVVRSKSRYPSSRMGVATYLDDSFEAARAYRARHAAYAALDEKTRARTLPPRKDLELETLAEIIEGKRLVHCHSYRQDEILMLLATADRFGFRVATLQHVLEGYKVAPEIAAHGAGASSFSDWWAYKIEVMDAIPWNGAIMHRAGVNVSFNSDSDELARRMNMEAAKAMRYGGLSPEQALALVTINPARQLKVDHRTGSLEVGKDADLAVWNGPPLSAFSRCEETWVDGVRRYRRADEPALQDSIRRARAELIARTLAPSGDDARAGGGEGEGRGGMRGGRGGRGRAPTLLERMLETREDTIWLNLARGRDPFPKKQGDCGCGPSADPLAPAAATDDGSAGAVPVAGETN